MPAPSVSFLAYFNVRRSVPLLNDFARCNVDGIILVQHLNRQETDNRDSKSRFLSLGSLLLTSHYIRMRCVTCVGFL